MDFIKRNYEKIILSIVLLGLVGVAGFLPVLIANDQEQLQQMADSLIHPPVRPLPDLDTSNQDAVILRIKATNSLDFSTTNRLFNPVMWQKDKNGNLIKVVKGTEVGPYAAVVAKISPLYYQLSLEGVNTDEVSPRYVIVVENQASDNPAQRRPHHYYISLGETNAIFALPANAIKGPPGNPTELDMVLNDTGQKIMVAPENPFQRVDGYMADLKYPPENGTFNAQRVGAQLNFAGDQYNIIAIDENDVILLAQSNQKKYILPYSP
jgi:hypothetical protein